MAGYMKPVDSYKDNVTCSICLQIFTYPVTLNCNHSFCLKCIQDHLKHKSSGDNYTCPECRAEFVEKPRLLKNPKLVEKVENLSKCQEKKTVCDYCFEEPVPAAMSCIQCETFFCVTHLRPHSERASLKDHILVDPTEAISLRKCEEHKEVLKLYCKQDHASICSLCSIMGKHKNHLILTIEESKNEIQLTFTENMKQLNLKRTKAEEAIKRLRELNCHVLETYSGYLEKTIHHYKGIKALVEDDEQQTLRFIEADRQAATLYIETQTKDWLEELDDIKRVIQHINTILNQSDSFRFLKGANCNEYRINYLLNKQMPDIHDNVIDDGKLSSLIKSIGKFANSLSKNDMSVRKALLACSIQPKRFDDTLYVLGSQGFTFGNHYWEVVVKGKTDWEIGVAYSSIPRKGKCWLGRNNVSWSLECSSDQYTAWHNSVPLKVTAKGKLNWVGVYLNYTGGMLVFYDAEKMAVLVSFYHKFTEALYPILNPCNNKGGNFAPLTVLQLKELAIFRQ
ncbi:LOW QUALITY PROTEIN: E3 ubiquitin/ISG15 ligase TRIM25-like [Pristis pectinata]|uniref:LOW QUALITY PROTEIN: E3 ubiquitin/ISG15 ligase TRIM25-like n=1 Tax=Pristis pectinata TaxID=685728 RepID=UPI00223D74FE|nr:LOW QUALITY PROTEIN: E3 ubiquitin/ISG15 ligase TRIM25-like [Pristis pectinata]